MSKISNPKDIKEIIIDSSIFHTMINSRLEYLLLLHESQEIKYSNAVIHSVNVSNEEICITLLNSKNNLTLKMSFPISVWFSENWKEQVKEYINSR